MPKHARSLSVDRRSCRALAGAAFFCAASAIPHTATAATARVQWLPPAAGAVAYNVYVRDGGSTHGPDPQWSGNPAPAADGSLSALVTFTPAASGVNYFAVVAVGNSGKESGLSGELPSGTPNPCRADSCVTKTSCDFSNRADGTSCDDASFCNGSETCRAGACDASAPRNCDDGIACTVDACDEAAGSCTHVGAAGCCLACDDIDPCLADACAQGDCAASPGGEIEVDRIRFQRAKSGIKLASKGRFTADPLLDPSLTGAIVELQTADGVVLYSSSIAASSIKARASGRRYRFTARPSESDPLENGLTHLDFRIRGSTWVVTAKAATPDLMAAFLEPTITWMVRLGPTCVRRLDVPCRPKSELSICR